MSKKPMQYWMRIMKFSGGLIVSSDGVFADKELCEECGHNCCEVSAQLAQTVDPNDIKGKVVDHAEGGKITRLGKGKAALDLD